MGLGTSAIELPKMVYIGDVGFALVAHLLKPLVLVSMSVSFSLLKG
jgi:hypothetical protein